MNIPTFLQSSLWSYPIDELDSERDAEYIITQVLNYSDWEGVKWLNKTYGVEKIKAFIQHPLRGLWFDRTLNFWEQMLNIRIDPELRKRAIMDINPDLNYKLPVSKT